MKIIKVQVKKIEYEEVKKDLMKYLSHDIRSIIKRKKRKKMNIIFKSGDYVSVPMTENLFWNRVGNLRHAMLTAENFEFRLLYFSRIDEVCTIMKSEELKTRK